MPFNVCDETGKHLGFIYSRFIEGGEKEALLVCLTDEKSNKFEVKYKELEYFLAEQYDFIGMFRKMQKDKLHDLLRQLWEKAKIPGDFDAKSMLTLIALKDIKIDFDSYFKIQPFEHKGFILLDPNKIIFHNNEYVVIDRNLDYVDENIDLLKSKPLYGKIIDYPNVALKVMSLGQGFLLGASLADYGGRNHIHVTKLKILSGNMNFEIDIPFQLSVNKDMQIAIYIKDNVITGVACNGVIYSFNLY